MCHVLCAMRVRMRVRLPNTREMTIRSVSAVCYRHVKSAYALGNVIAKTVNTKRVLGSIASGTARVNFRKDTSTTVELTPGAISHMNISFSNCPIR